MWDNVHPIGTTAPNAYTDRARMVVAQSGAANAGRWVEQRADLAGDYARAFPGTNRIYGNSGNSFVAVVEFGDRVRAKSMLAGGQNANPDSPHFDDQALRYVDRQFKDVAFYREDVEARAARTYNPGQ